MRWINFMESNWVLRFYPKEILWSSSPSTLLSTHQGAGADPEGGPWGPKPPACRNGALGREGLAGAEGA